VRQAVRAQIEDGPGPSPVRRGRSVSLPVPQPCSRPTACLLVTAVLFEMHDEWIAFPRCYLPEGSMDQFHPTEPGESAPVLPNTTNATDD
jgi:hypothetical protein